MKAPETVPVKIGTYRTTLPVFGDRLTSEKIVARLEACHLAVREKISADTVAEVIRVAYEFACEAHQLKEEQEEQDKELLRNLSDILGQVRSVLKTHTPAAGQ
jgi:hypothetical protein